MLTFNHHVLSHLPFLIEQLSCLLAVSARSLERRIGYIKRAVKSTKSAGVNASNLLEQEQIFNFLRMAKIIDFEAPYHMKEKGNDTETFRYHPKHIKDSPDAEETKMLPQQWSPLPPDIPFASLIENPQKNLSKYDITYANLTTAMKDYLARLTQNQNVTFRKFHADQTVQFSERLWMDAMVYSCEAYKKTKKSTRNDSYCQFTANHKNQ
jgi:hypothetical protein